MQFSSHSKTSSGAVNTPSRKHRSRTHLRPKIRFLRTPQLNATRLPVLHLESSLVIRCPLIHGISPRDSAGCLCYESPYLIAQIRSSLDHSPPARVATRMGRTERETKPCTRHGGPRDQEVFQGWHDHDQVFHLVSIRPLSLLLAS